MNHYALTASLLHKFHTKNKFRAGNLLILVSFSPFFVSLVLFICGRGAAAPFILARMQLYSDASVCACCDEVSSFRFVVLFVLLQNAKVFYYFDYLITRCRDHQHFIYANEWAWAAIVIFFRFIANWLCYNDKPCTHTNDGNENFMHTTESGPWELILSG